MEKAKKIFIVGYFGYSSGKLDGQTVKTRAIYDLIEKHSAEQHYILTYYDTEEFRYKRASVFRMLKYAVSCDKMVLIPCTNNIKILFPVLYVLSLIFRFDIVHIAIGSWHVPFFHKHPFQRYMAKHIKVFFSEVRTVDESLSKEFGFTNNATLPNFRVHDYVPEISNRGQGLRIVFMSRITTMKGTGTVFAIGKYLRDKYSGDVTIDFYGQISENEEKFFSEVEANEIISYKGVLKPECIYTTLNEYDLLLLPTRYYMEGFPGAILDAYISGIPVLVSKWLFSAEFIEEGITGFTVDMDDVDGFCKIIDMLYGNGELLLQLKHNAHRKASEYSEDTVWELLENYL